MAHIEQNIAAQFDRSQPGRTSPISPDEPPEERAKPARGIELLERNVAMLTRLIDP